MRNDICANWAASRTPDRAPPFGRRNAACPPRSKQETAIPRCYPPGIVLGPHIVNLVKRRVLLTFAALSPGVVALTLQEMAVSLAFMVLGIFGAISLAAATLSVFPHVGPSSLIESMSRKPYPSLLLPSASDRVRRMAPEPPVIRAQLKLLMENAHSAPRFLTEKDQIGMVLSRILARWDSPHLAELSDDQIRELWLVERLMRASPAEAGALSRFFASPNAMLAMRDALAEPATA